MPTASPGFDIRLDENGDLPLQNGGVITGLELTIQRLKRRLLIQRGEVSFDRFFGIDWNGWLQVRPPQLALMEAALRSSADTCPGVARCSRIDSVFDKAQRTVTFSMDVTLITGESVRITTSVGTNGNPAITVLVLSPQAMLA